LIAAFEIQLGCIFSLHLSSLGCVLTARIEERNAKM
jgi:hypothetical protein